MSEEESLHERGPRQRTVVLFSPATMLQNMLDGFHDQSLAHAHTRVDLLGPVNSGAGVGLLRNISLPRNEHDTFDPHILHSGIFRQGPQSPFHLILQETQGWFPATPENGSNETHSMTYKEQITEKTELPMHNQLAWERVLQGVQDKDVPSLFVCPITLEIMLDPYVAMDGHSYERSALVKWLLATDVYKSPKTNIEMGKNCECESQLRCMRDFDLNASGNTMIPNKALQIMIRDWLEKNGVDLSGLDFK